ncbi:activator of Hsp90 ATPase-like protein [Aliiruegeria haliotis]|uniref:Activator of Hsp90 ATPase-like protein n=1 Tax=Aliiruegeria haliotis TaxID=1280846 RepID=A0A2T0RVR9_9RHOB|nr:SRPBCC domain-containing protein [Aliiruegeria haliotis]PRY25296.1 activator of Hsp90 ATPase-like protein [Aliiruegeria haliotis]
MPETLPALRKTYVLPLPAEVAFRLFAEELGDWWPLESHSLSALEGKLPLSVRAEPRLGGRIVEIRHDAAEAEWGTFTAWDPVRRIAFDWYVGRERAQATQVEVTFSQRGDETVLGLVHSGFENLGPGAEASLANYDEGWDLVLGERFLKACGG